MNDRPIAAADVEPDVDKTDQALREERIRAAVAKQRARRGAVKKHASKAAVQNAVNAKLGRQ